MEEAIKIKVQKGLKFQVEEVEELKDKDANRRDLTVDAPGALRVTVTRLNKLPNEFVNVTYGGAASIVTICD